jgi:hypothetical protein
LGLALLGEAPDDPLGHGARSSGVASEDFGKRRLDVNQFDPGDVVGEQVDPGPASLAEQVGGVEGERAARPQMLPTRRTSRSWSPSEDHSSRNFPARVAFLYS